MKTELQRFNLTFILLVIFLIGVFSAYVAIYKSSAEPIAEPVETFENGHIPIDLLKNCYNFMNAIECESNENLARDKEALEQEEKTERIRELINAQY